MVRLKNYRGIIEKNPHRRVVKNMNELLKFRSIWTKVFGLTATLVTIMLIAASVSFAILTQQLHGLAK
jgi:hypothetical protein